MRVDQDRTEKTSFCIVDAQSVKNTDTAETKGYHAGKKVSSIKRHIAVDTQGLPHAIHITTANVTDRDGAIAMVTNAKEHLEPVQSLLSNSVKKASTTICKLVLIFLSQFFHNRLYFSSQPKERSTTQRFGITTNLCKSLRLATSTVAPIIFFIAVENGSPV